jgi:hypothetical protein
MRILFDWFQKQRRSDEFQQQHPDTWSAASERVAGLHAARGSFNKNFL